MTKYTVRNPIANAMQLTTDNIEEVEKWCGGSIKGTKLPVHARVIEIWNGGEEITANIGDYIVKCHGLEETHYSVMGPDDFHDFYVEAI